MEREPYVPPLVTLPVLIALSALSCSSAPRTDLEGEDETLFTSVSFSLPLDEEDSEGGRAGVRADIEISSGKFDQVVSAGEIVQLDDVAFGPGGVTFSFDHAFLGLGMYAGKRIDSLDFEIVAGLAGSLLDAKLSRLGLSESAHVDSAGLYVDGTAAVNVIDPLALFFALRFYNGLNGLDEVKIFTVQLGARWTLTDTFGLAAGWQDWDYSAKREDGFPDPSDLELGLDGLFLELDVTL